MINNQILFFLCYTKIKIYLKKISRNQKKLKEIKKMNNNQEKTLIDTKEKLEKIDTSLNDYQEKIILEAIKKINNPFVNLTVYDVAKDLKVGENMAYTIFKREDFPSVNIGRCWKIALISYLLWKTQKRV